jgi:hypothetical protein
MVDRATAIAASTPIDPAWQPSEIEARLRELMQSSEVKLRVGAVVASQRILWDAMNEDIGAAYRKVRPTLENMTPRQALGTIFPFVAIAEKAFQQQRKAHGIPDVTKLEIEDKSGARMHADAIERRKQARFESVG